METKCFIFYSINKRPQILLSLYKQVQYSDFILPGWHKAFCKILKIPFLKNLENRKYFFKNILFISIVLLTLVLVIDKSNAKYGNKTAIAKAWKRKY